MTKQPAIARRVICFHSSHLHGLLLQPTWGTHAKCNRLLSSLVFMLMWMCHSFSSHMYWLFFANVCYSHLAEHRQDVLTFLRTPESHNFWICATNTAPYHIVEIQLEYLLNPGLYIKMKETTDSCLEIRRGKQRRGSKRCISRSNAWRPF